MDMILICMKQKLICMQQNDQILLYKYHLSFLRLRGNLGLDSIDL